MRKIAEIKSDRRIQIVKMGFDGMAGYVNSRQNRPPNEIAFIASWAGGWEHVSVSLRNRCPTWDEMCLVKDIFGGMTNVSCSSIRLKMSISTCIRIAYICGRKSAKKRTYRRKSL